MSFSGDLLTHEIKPEQELLIIDVAVTDSKLADFPGVLSFGYLMEQLGGESEDKTKLLLNFLTKWESEQTVNTFKVPAREAIRDLVIEPWKKADGQEGVSDLEWKVNYKNAPFRLTALINRIDMARIPELDPTRDELISLGINPDSSAFTSGNAYYGPSISGEMRFTYCVCDQKTKEPLAGSFTTIFELANREYPMKAGEKKARRINDGNDGQRWAMRWHKLGEFDEIGAEYLTELEQLVRDNIETKGDLAPVLNRIRTNEGALAKTREMREFNLNSSRSAFEQVTMKQTPDLSYLGKHSPKNRALANYINNNAELIKLSRHTMNDTLEVRRNREPFLAGSALFPDDPAEFFWYARGVRDREARRAFSMNTCNGCHAKETATTNCLHIAPRKAGEPSQLSAFLGMSGERFLVRDPARPAHRDEMSEIEKRIAIFQAILSKDASSSKAMRKLKAERAGWAH